MGSYSRQGSHPTKYAVHPTLPAAHIMIVKVKEALQPEMESLVICPPVRLGYVPDEEDLSYACVFKRDIISFRDAQIAEANLVSHGWASLDGFNMLTCFWHA